MTRSGAATRCKIWIAGATRGNWEHWCMCHWRLSRVVASATAGAAVSRGLAYASCQAHAAAAPQLALLCSRWELHSRGSQPIFNPPPMSQASQLNVADEARRRENTHARRDGGGGGGGGSRRVGRHSHRSVAKACLRVAVPSLLLPAQAGPLHCACLDTYQVTVTAHLGATTSMVIAGIAFVIDEHCGLLLYRAKKGGTSLVLRGLVG